MKTNEWKEIDIMKKNKYRLLSAVLAMSFIFSTAVVSSDKVSAQESTKTTDVSSGSALQPTAVPEPTPTPVDVTKIKISKKKAIIMVGKTVTPVISGTTSTVTWKSSNSQIATVDESGKIKGKKKGKAVITASMDGVTRTCTVTVVAKMKKKDFSKFNSENFVHFCQRNRYDSGFAWNGQWKGGSKKKKTARGIKVGSKKSTVHNAYGELNWKKCTSKDPFTKMKGLKKNKVKTYGDVTYGKYRIRFYLNSKSKVVAIIFACNIKKIKKKHLKKYI